MERPAKKQSSFDYELTSGNVEEYVTTFIGLIEPGDLIGTQEERGEFSQTLSLFKSDIRSQVSDLSAGAMLRKLDEAVAIRHFDAVQQVLDEGSVTPDFMTTIRQVPVALSPVQRNIDKLHMTALADQHQARTANKDLQSNLRDRAELSAKVAASYAADTPVVKNGLVTIVGEQYTLQKLHETKRQLPKEDDARKDVDGLVRDAYGDNFVLKDARILNERVRQAVATVATAAVLSTLSNTAAYAGETKTSEVIPDEKQADKYISDPKEKVNISAPIVKQVAHRVLPSKPENPPIGEAKTDVITPSANDQTSDDITKIRELADTSDKKDDNKTAGNLTFRLPSSVTKEKLPNNMSNDLVIHLPDTAVKTDTLEAGGREKGLIEEVADSDSEKEKTDKVDQATADLNGNEGEEKSYSNKTGVLKFVVPSKKDHTDTVSIPNEKKDTTPAVQIEDILDDSKLTFKLPSEKRQTNEEKPVKITLTDDDNELRFSFKKGQKSGGVKPIDLPGGLEIIPIPNVPAPGPEATTPAPEASDPALSETVQAAQDMADHDPKWKNYGIVMRILIEGGMQPMHAAAFIGNFDVESPGLESGKKQGDGGPGRGMAQWTVNDVRFEALQKLAAERGATWDDLATQAHFVLQETQTTEASAYAKIKATTTREDATLAVSRLYERPNPLYAHNDRRIASANAVAGVYNDKLKAIRVARHPSPSTGEVGTEIVGWPSTGDDAMEMFNQCDPRWGNILSPNGLKACRISCGPTNVAMAVELLKPELNVTPKETIEFANANRLWFTPAGGAPDSGGVTFDAMIKLANNWGIRGNQMGEGAIKRFEAYKQILKDGGVIIAAGSGPFPFVTPDVGAHFVMIRGVTADGKFLVADPYPKTPDTNTVAWDASQIMQSTFGAVVLYK
jgi:hypothetical protein